MAAISATDAIALAVSIWIPTNVSALARAAYSPIGVRPEPAVAIAAVHSTLAAGPEFGPADGLLRLLRRADHADHHSPRTGFQRPHDRGVVGGRQPDEVIQAAGLGCERRELDVLHADAGMLGIEPERIELAVLAEDLDQLGAQQLPEAEHPDHLPLGKEFFDPLHPSLPSTKGVDSSNKNQEGRSPGRSRAWGSSRLRTRRRPWADG